MRYIVLGLFMVFAAACGPLKYTTVHFVSVPEANEGRALPLHIVPVDEALKGRLDGMTAEDWFISNEVQTLTGIQKRVLQGAQKEVIEVERVNKKNDFLVIVDFAQIENPDQQKLHIGDKYYRAKEVYVLVERDKVRIVSKAVYKDYLRAR